MLEFCPACDAAIPKNAAFCEECGEPVPAAPAKTRGQTTASRKERQAAKRELLAAKKRVDTLKLTYNALGVVFGLFLILFASWWWRFATRGWSGTGIVEIVRMATIFSVVDTVLMFVCARYVRRSPVVLGSIGAALVTVSTGLILVGFPWSDAGPVLIGIVGTRVALNVSLWALLPAAVKLNRLLEEHPELDRRPRTRGEATDRESAPLPWKLIAAYVGPGLAVLALGWWLTRPPGPSAMARTFEEAWATGDPAEVGALFERSTSAKLWLRREVGRELPPLDRTGIEVKGIGARITYDLEGLDEDLVLGVEKMDDGHWDFAELKMR